MNYAQRIILTILVWLVCLTWVSSVFAESPVPENKDAKPEISFSSDMGDAMIRKAGRVKEELQKQAESLFQREPLGWDLDTLGYLYESILSLPLKIPVFTRHILEQGRVLGFAGSLIILTFIVAIFYSLIGHKKVLERVEIRVRPFVEKLPEKMHPYIMSAIKVVVEALIPLILLGFFSLINALIIYRAPWFHLLGRLLILWTIGRLVMGVLNEVLTQ